MTPPDGVTAGTYTLKASVMMDGEEYREGVQTIAYHHIQTRYLFHPAEATVQALDVSVAPVRVGYVRGVGDEIPTAIRQLGAELDFLETEDLAEGDLGRYDVIMTGVRAYLNRDDLRAYNHRLLDYVSGGGTLLVQYNKFEFNRAQWGPYPKKVSRNRVTVEEAPIDILVPRPPGVPEAEPHHRGRLGRLGAGARPLLPRPRRGSSLRRSPRLGGSLGVQPRG